VGVFFFERLFATVVLLKEWWQWSILDILFNISLTFNVFINHSKECSWNLVLVVNFKEGMRMLHSLFTVRAKIHVFANCTLVSYTRYLVTASITVDSLVILLWFRENLIFLNRNEVFLTMHFLKKL
jgi:hypothetical protein